MQNEFLISETDVFNIELQVKRVPLITVKDDRHLRYSQDLHQ